MSLLAYTGLGSVILTAAGLGRMGLGLLLRTLDRADEHCATGPPGGEQTALDGLAVCSTHRHGDRPSAQ